MTKSIAHAPSPGESRAFSAVNLVTSPEAGSLDAASLDAMAVQATCFVAKGAPDATHEAGRALGARWASEVQRSLRMEKRRAAGGWPGTMREAQARATWLLATAEAAPRERAFDAATVAELTKVVYSSARSTWLSHAETEEDLCDVEQ